MLNNQNIIIDASVFVKWFLPDEEDTNQALQIKKDYAQGAIFISLPSITIYEVNNVLRSAVSRSRMSQKDAFLQFRSFLGLDFIIYSTRELQERILEKAIGLDISSYDASYIVLVETLKFPFYTADQKLIQKAKSPLVKNLSTYH